MTIATTISSKSYTGNGSTAVYPYPFKIMEAADLVVIRTVIATGVQATLVLDSDYTVSGVGVVTGGNVTLLAGVLSSAYTLLIKRVVDIVQESVYTDGDNFPAAAHEDALDRQTMVSQQLSDLIDRAPLVPDSFADIPLALPANLTGLPAWVRWNAAGTALENTTALPTTELQLGWIEVAAYGSTYTQAALTAAIVANPDGGALYFRGPLPITSAINIPAKFTIANGLEHIFNCSGAGAVTFAIGSSVTIYPHWWGASPSATAAVNTAAIQASFDALISYTAWELPPGEYNINAALTVGNDSTPLYGVTMDFKGRLLADSCSGLDFRYFRYGNVTGIKVKRLTQAWDVGTTTPDFGVRFGYCRRSNIGIDFIENFSYGVEIDGRTGISNSFMTFYLGYIAECKIGLYVTSVGTGWNNENSYYGGQFTSNYTGITLYTNVKLFDDAVKPNTITHATGWPATFVTGFAVYVSSSALSTQILPAPLVNGTTYYIIKVDATTIKLATSYANAMAGTAIDLTTQGTATLRIGKAGSWAVYFASAAVPYDNHRFFAPSFEALNNGVYFGGYAGSYNFLLQHPRFEDVANYIEAAPRNLIWVQGAQPLGRTQIVVYCPRLYDTTTAKSYVHIQGGGYYDLDSYSPSFAAPKASSGETYAVGAQLSFYNKYDLSQVTAIKNEVKDKFSFKVDDIITDMAGTSTHQTSYPLNKGFEEATAPGPAGTDMPMTYAKNAVVWNTVVAAGQPMGWVCSVPGSVYDATSITGTGTLVGTTLTILTGTGTRYLFPGAFVLIDGVQHQIKRKVSYDTTTLLGVYEVYASIAGDKTGVAIAHSHPTWIPMMNYPGGTSTTPTPFPASTVEQRNTNAYPVRVTVIGGTVTVIDKGPTSGSLVTTGATAGAFILQPQEYIAITYSVAPTWTWTGM